MRPARPTCGLSTGRPAGSIADPFGRGICTGADSIVVLEGLAPGEDVAVSAVSQLRDGMTVRPVEEVSAVNIAELSIRKSASPG